eukprot:gene13840-15916_t
MIIKASGQYDKEVIQRLRLENLGLQRITNLESCFALMDLCLSHNEISAIAGLEQLVALKRLDLSFNKIRKIERLQDLLSLEYLDLRANSISSVNDLDELQQLPALQSLFLQGNDGEDTNPVCRHPSYITIVMRSLPSLQIIDGGHLNITEAFSSLEEHLKLLQPSGEDNKTPPTVPWLDGLLDADSTGPGGAFEIPASDDDIDHIASGSKQLKPVTEAHQQITDMMNEECAHLLRKAQSAVSKATLSN